MSDRTYIRFLVFLSVLAVCSQALSASDVRWVQIPNSGYNPTINPAVVYEENSQRVLLFGGGYTVLSSGGTETQYYSSDFWQFKDGAMQQLSLGGTINYSGEPIRPRAYPVFCYNPSAQKTIISGGMSGPQYSDTWQLSGNSLQQVGSSFPSGDNALGLFYNNVREKVNLIHSSGQIYEWNGASWASLGVSLPNWGNGSLDHFGFSYNSTSKKLVVFGGITNRPTWTWSGDTYVFNAQSNMWSKISFTSGPSARGYGAMVWCPSYNTHLMVGGTSTAGYLDDVWEFDDTTNSWQQLGVETPLKWCSHKLVYDAAGTRILSLGGFNGEVDSKRVWVDRVYQLQFINRSLAKDWSKYSE